MSDPDNLMVADTSAVINLNASGCADRVIAALPCKVAVVDVIHNELEFGRIRGRGDADFLRDLAKAGLIDIVTLGDEAERHFEQLVIGPAATTLDDGEAATIAYAAVTGGTAILDEKKAIRMCAQQFPKLRIRSTVDILAHPSVQQAFGQSALSDAVFNALRYGRMRILSQHVAWVVGLIGNDRAAQCASLPHSVRSQLPPGRS